MSKGLESKMASAARALLIALALWCITTGLAYHPIIGETPRMMDFLFARFPVRFWAYAWIVAGMLIIVGLRWYRARQIGTALAMGLSLLLTVVYLYAWFSGDMGRGWVSAKNYVLICVVVISGAATLAEGVLASGPSGTDRPS